MDAVPFISRSAQRHSVWLRWVLLCTVFSALHGLLGAWVVSVVSSEPLVEICTPGGVQWVAMDSLPDQDGPSDWPQGLAKPCVWAMAHMAVPLGAGVEGAHGSHAVTPLGGLLGNPSFWVRMPCIAARVLLMAPMRAPPG